MSESLADSPAEHLPPPQPPVPAVEAAEPDTRSASLWRNRDYKLILFGQGLSSVGDAVNMTALPLLVLFLTGSGLAMGIVGVLQMLPDLLFGLPAGALADRWDRRRMMLYADIARGVLTALIPLSLLFGIPTMAVIFIVVAPIHLMRVLWLAAYTASVPSLVGRDQVGPANSYLEATYSIGFFAGPGLAGLLASRIGPAPTIGIDAASFLLSAATLFFIRGRLQQRTERVQTRIVSDIREGIAYVARHRALRIVVAFWTSVSVIGAALIPVMTYYITLDRGLGPETLGFVLSVYSVGSLIGALTASRLMKRDGSLGWLMLGGQAITGSMIVALALSPTLVPLLAVSFVAGITTSVVVLAYITFRATSAPDAMLGRVGSTARTISLGLQPLGMLAAGLLLDATGGTITLYVMGGAIVLACLLFAASGTMRSAAANSAPATAPASA